MLTAHKHEMGVRLYQAGQFVEASKVLGEALGEGITSELANDWGAAELACGHADRAEQGFVQALKLDPGNAEAAENLGVLLGGLGRVAEAICVLEQAVPRAGAGNQARLSALLAEYRNRYPSQTRSEAEAALQSALANLRSACATPKGAESVVAARLPSRIERRPSDDCLVYKPDFTQVTYHVAELRGGSWSRREDHVVGMGNGASLRWRTVAGRVYALLAHFPWGGKVAVIVNGKLHDIVDLYSHGKYTEPMEVFRADAAAPVEVELRIVGKNPLSQSDQMASFGFLVNREKSSEPPRVETDDGFIGVQKQQVETDDGFIGVQKQQIVNWLESIKRRGLTLEEVTEQRKGAYTLRVSEAMAFMREGSRVLDVGCGYVFRDILKDVIQLRGIDYWLQDIDPEVCASNRSLFTEFGMAADHVFCGDNTNLPYPDALFDGVFSSHCLEHSRDLSRTFSELSRIIRLGGAFVFAVPRNWDRAEEHIYAPLNGGWEAFTERHGFRVVSSNLGCYYGEGGENDLMIVATRQ